MSWIVFWMFVAIFIPILSVIIAGLCFSEGHDIKGVLCVTLMFICLFGGLVGLFVSLEAYEDDLINNSIVECCPECGQEIQGE